MVAAQAGHPDGQVRLRNIARVHGDALERHGWRGREGRYDAIAGAEISLTIKSG